MTATVLEAGLVEPGDEVSIEAVSVPLTDVLDLHSFRPGETQKVVTAYLDEARRAGFGEVRIIHGRGRGVQRTAIHRVLAGTPGVAAFADAPPARGGWGATVVRLGSPRRTRPQGQTIAVVSLLAAVLTASVLDLSLGVLWILALTGVLLLRRRIRLAAWLVLLAAAGLLVWGGRLGWFAPPAPASVRAGLDSRPGADCDQSFGRRVGQAIQRCWRREKSWPGAPGKSSA